MNSSPPGLKDGLDAANHHADQNLKPCFLRIIRHRSEAEQEQRPVWASGILWTEGKGSCDIKRGWFLAFVVGQNEPLYLLAFGTIGSLRHGLVSVEMLR